MRVLSQWRSCRGKLPDSGGAQKLVGRAERRAGRAENTSSPEREKYEADGHGAKLDIGSFLGKAKDRSPEHNFKGS